MWLRAYKTNLFYNFNLKEMRETSIKTLVGIAVKNTLSVHCFHLFLELIWPISFQRRYWFFLFR